jgi:hypothetical protein
MGSGVNNKVFAVEAGQSPGTVYAAGSFTFAGGSPANHVAQWNGSSWSTVGGGANYYVWDLIHYNGQLHAGGGFNTVDGGTVAWGMARWNGTAWNPLAGGIHGEVYALEKFNGDLYAAGFIDTLSGFNTGRGIMKWNGSAWSSLGGAPGDGVAGPPGFRVYALIAFNNELYVGGSFVTANGTTVNNIAKWNGTSWSAIGSGTNGAVRAFGVHNGELYVGGEFTLANGTAVNRLAKLSGTTFSSVGGGTDGPVYGIGSYMNELYATGVFTSAGGVTAGNIARWNGTVWKDLIGGLNFEGYTLTTIGGSLYVGGFYSVIGATITNNIAYWVLTTGVEENEKVRPLGIFPNPGDGVFYFEAAFVPDEVRVYDAAGALVAHEKGLLRRTLDLRNLPQGMYTVAARTGAVARYGKVVIGR